MKKEKKLTKEEHIECAKKLAIAQHLIDDVYKLCQSKFYKSSKLMKSLKKLSPLNHNGVFLNVVLSMDEDLVTNVAYEDIVKYNISYYNYNRTSNLIQSKLCTNCQELLQLKQKNFIN